MLTFAEPLYHESGTGSCNLDYKGGSMMLPCSEKRLVNMCKNGKFHSLDDSSNELKESLKSNSLHEFAQLAGYLQTRVVPGGAKSVNGPDEE